MKLQRGSKTAPNTQTGEWRGILVETHLSSQAFSCQLHDDEKNYFTLSV